jgi:hypothetical protein
MMTADLPSLLQLQSFFTERLLHQRQASPHTIAGYRDCFRLLLHFAQEVHRKSFFLENVISSAGNLKN